MKFVRNFQRVFPENPSLFKSSFFAKGGSTSDVTHPWTTSWKMNKEFQKYHSAFTRTKIKVVPLLGIFQFFFVLTSNVVELRAVLYLGRNSVILFVYICIFIWKFLWKSIVSTMKLYRFTCLIKILLSSLLEFYSFFSYN